ncbi:MAG: hypothetical protein OSB47_13335, partial [Pirellulaceae bacterium]|nr:hypothetical protein [Pirellulaceae bacterium]
AAEGQVHGLVCLGYPFHPPGKPVGQRIEHLRGIECPTLILQGERDPFGTRRDVARYRLSEQVRLHWLTAGNHSFQPPKSSVASVEQNMEQGLDAIAAFCSGLVDQSES